VSSRDFKPWGGASISMLKYFPDSSRWTAETAS
jgi:hypothetical protein